MSCSLRRCGAALRPMAHQALYPIPGHTSAVAAGGHGAWIASAGRYAWPPAGTGPGRCGDRPPPAWGVWISVEDELGDHLPAAVDAELGKDGFEMVLHGMRG